MDRDPYPSHNRPPGTSSGRSGQPPNLPPKPHGISNYQRQPQITRAKFTISSGPATSNSSNGKITKQSKTSEERRPARPPMSTLTKAIIVVVGVAVILLAFAFFSTEWLASESRYYGAKFEKLGLWRVCFRSFRAPNDYDFRKFYVGCRWVFANEYKNIRSFLFPAFFIATQILFSLGFLFIIFTCIGVLALQQCFVVDRESYAIKILSLISVLSAVCCTSAVSIFALYGNEEDWMPDPDHNYFSWSFVSALLGSILLWIASLLFYIESRLLSRQEKQSHRDFSRGSRA